MSKESRKEWERKFDTLYILPVINKLTSKLQSAQDLLISDNRQGIYYKGGINVCVCVCNNYLIQNSQAVKKECSPEKGYGEKRCEIQGGGQEMAVMVG